MEEQNIDKKAFTNTWIGLLLFISASTIGFVALYAIQNQLIDKIAVKQAERLTSVLEEFRGLYTSEIVSNAKQDGLQVIHNYKNIENTLPLPATLNKLLSESINKVFSNSKIRLYSKYPFPWKEEKSLDNFENKVLDILSTNKVSQYHEISLIEGVKTLRFAVPDIMRASCIGCHNTHPDSPKVDWQVGDIGGALEIIMPVNATANLISSELRKVWVLMSVLGCLALAIFYILNRQLVKQHTLTLNNHTAYLHEKDENIHVKELLKEILNKEEKLRSILDTAADGIITINAINCFVYTFNPAATSIFGYKEHDIKGKSLELILPQIHQIIFDLKSSDKNHYKSINCMALKQDGTSIPIAVSIGKPNTKNNLIYTVIIQDLTEQKKLESQLIQSQKLKSIGQLSAGMAHEINTPTQFVLSNISFIAESFGKIKDVIDEKKINDDDELKFLVSEIPVALRESQDGIDRISKIVLAMKHFSHPGDEIKTESDLNKLINSTVTVAQNEWKYNAEMNIEGLDKNLPYVSCLPNEINQVILNIIINASHSIHDCIQDKKYTRGLIKITTRFDSDWVFIDIFDNGKGMDKDTIDKIFDPFFTTKEVGKGTGQGLSLAHSVIVKKHSGRIKVESEFEEYTQFTLQIPLINTIESPQKELL